MKFVDQVDIHVSGGAGGNGCLGFRREKFVPFGGPDGGDGGNGGSVYLTADAGLTTLVDFRYKRRYLAQAGKSGRGACCTGRQGDDLVIPVPVGTSVYLRDDVQMLVDLVTDGQTYCVAAGGAHGLGNVRFKSSVNRAPRKFTPGKPGEVVDLRLELKLLADVGLLGLPNAGKSSLIRRVSAATPKVADYPFTTLHPNLGVVRLDSQRQFVVADIPGLIEGASHGVGLGLQFLRHLSRCRVLLHLVDMSDDEQTLFDSCDTVFKELAAYDIGFLQKPCLLVLNKQDVIHDRALVQAYISRLSKQAMDHGVTYVSCHSISAINGEGVPPLVESLWSCLNLDQSAAVDF